MGAWECAKVLRSSHSTELLFSFIFIKKKNGVYFIETCLTENDGIWGHWDMGKNVMGGVFLGFGWVDVGVLIFQGNHLILIFMF